MKKISAHEIITSANQFTNEIIKLELTKSNMPHDEKNSL